MLNGRRTVFETIVSLRRKNDGDDTGSGRTIRHSETAIPLRWKSGGEDIRSSRATCHSEGAERVKNPPDQRIDMRAKCRLWTGIRKSLRIHQEKRTDTPSAIQWPASRCA